MSGGEESSVDLERQVGTRSLRIVNAKLESLYFSLKAIRRHRRILSSGMTWSDLGLARLFDSCVENGLEKDWK